VQVNCANVQRDEIRLRREKTFIMQTQISILLDARRVKEGEFFERAKTEFTSRGGEPIVISCYLKPEMWKTITKWGNKNQDPETYIFPILIPGLTPIRQYELKDNFLHFINKNMAKICEQEGMLKRIKTMETRHSASTLMKNAGVSPHFIKESLGHTSLQTTENYLAGFENAQIKEFSKILDDFKIIENSK